MNFNRILAQIDIPGSTIDIENPTEYEDIGELITTGLNIAIGAAAVICVVVLIFSGYMYITASGDEAKVEKASKSLTFAIVGLAIAFIAVLLVNFVLDNILKNQLDTSMLLSLIA
jgi:TRAP-type C4-dicarboxylate transport system permease small subunit